MQAAFEKSVPPPGSASIIYIDGSDAVSPLSPSDRPLARAKPHSGRLRPTDTDGGEGERKNSTSTPTAVAPGQRSGGRWVVVVGGPVWSGSSLARLAVTRTGGRITRSGERNVRCRGLPSAAPCSPLLAAGRKKIKKIKKYCSGGKAGTVSQQFNPEVHILNCAPAPASEASGCEKQTSQRCPLLLLRSPSPLAYSRYRRSTM